MDLEPASTSLITKETEFIAPVNSQLDIPRNEREDPFTFRDSSIAILGIAIALATFGVPIAAVLTGRSVQKESILPTAMDLDGSPATIPVSLSRIGQPRS